MSNKKTKNNIILGVLFFLPVAFLLMLYPSKTNFNPLDVVKENVLDITNLSSVKDTTIVLKEHITVLGFLGNDPESKIVETSNLKELVYNKFKGFRNFQFVMLVSIGSEAKTKRLIQELNKYSEHKYWHFVYTSDSDARKLFKSLRSSLYLDGTNATSSFFIVDKDLNQRGRLDDRDKKAIERGDAELPLTAYDATEVSIIKNKMAAEDVRVLLEEYRRSGKRNDDSTKRRAQDLNPDKEKTED